MEQNLTVVLKKQAIPVPNTGTLSDPNSLNLGTTLSDLVGGISVILTIALGICFVIYQAKKNNLAKILTKIFTVTSLTTFVLASIMSLNTFANNTGNTNNTNNSSNVRSLSITLENSTLELQPTSEDTFAYTKSNIIVNESTNYGYTLSAYTTTPDLTNTKDSTQKISSLNSSSPIVLNSNTWGFSKDKPQDSTSPVWTSLPQTEAAALTIKDIDASTPSQDTTNVYFGINVNDKLALGEYKGSITYTIVAKPELISYLDTGPTINIKMKNLANNTTDATTETDDYSIKAFVKATHLPASFIPAEANTISISTSPFPIYIFFDDVTGTMYYYTEARDVIMHSNSSSVFRRLTAITSISGASGWDASQTTIMDRLIQNCINLTDLSPLSNWDVGRVETFRFAFAGLLGATRMTYTDLSPLKDWNVSSVKDMNQMFKNTSITDVDALKDWNTSSVTDMAQLFNNNTSLVDINGLRKWDTSSVINMSNLFGGSSGGTAITNIDALENWKTSSVTNMSSMFHNASSLINIDGASKWNTSAVTNMQAMFSNASALTDINALSSWNTSAVTNMSRMFYGASSLTNINGASGWNTSAVTDMFGMFYGASSLTNINGAKNWDTGNVTDIRAMFNGVNNIDATVLNNWNVSNVTNKAGAFTCPIDKRPSWY